MADSKNIIVIGGGPGGYVAAIRAAQLGAQVVLVEKGALGGTCVNWGCIPTKALLRSAEVLSLAKKAETFGVIIEKVSLDFASAMKWKESTIKRSVSGITSLMRKNKVKVIKGTGAIIDPKTVRVIESKEEIKGDSIIIATGSKTATVPIKGIDGQGVMTSDDALVMDQLPQSVLIVGGGVVGLEFAQVLGRMGAKVTVVEMMPQVLPGEDAEVAQMLTEVLKKGGIEIYSGATITSIEDAKPDGKKASFTTADGSKEEKTVEKVLVAVGRRPNTDDLGIEKLGVAMEKGRIVVNERMETSVPGIYAIGDVVGGVMLAHVAMVEGKCAVENAMGLSSKADYLAVPRCIYTSPEVAAVGLTEADAKKEYQDIRVGRFPFIANGRASTLNEAEGLVKIVTDAKYGQILGVQILGPEASELIAEVVLAMQLEATPEEIASCIHAHPTLSEAIMEAALNVDGKALNI